LLSLPPLALSLVVLLAAAGRPAPADESRPGISLILTGASAHRGEQDTLFRCQVILDNATGKELAVRSNFSSVFDGLELMITTREGKTLIQQPYTFHQSPFAPPGREFTLKRGRTEATLVFPVHAFPRDAKAVKVRLVGSLPGSTYERLLATDTIEVKVTD
jgi:hypothetical protein